jgi:anaerobic ribonucleoside-triphosphate reductase activating protein
LTVLCQELKKKGLNIWSYTGYTYDELIRGDAGPHALELLKNLDVLVDGPFVISLLSKECLFRGSTNQRLIDVPRSLREGKAIDVDTKSFNFGL